MKCKKERNKAKRARKKKAIKRKKLEEKRRLNHYLSKYVRTKSQGAFKEDY